MKKIIIIFGFIAISMLLISCQGETTYEANYQLDDVELFSVHDQLNNPVVFVTNDQKIIMTKSDLIDTQTVDLLFGSHDEKSESKIEYRDITDEVGIDDDEKIIEILSYFEGWMFLTDNSNIYTYAFVDEPEYTSNFVIEEALMQSIIQDDKENEVVFNIEDYWINLRSTNRLIVAKNNNPTILSAYTFPDNLFGNEETIYQSISIDRNNYYFVLGSGDFYIYDIDLETLTLISSELPLDEDEIIIDFKINWNNSYYFTNKGNIGYIDLSDYAKTYHQKLDIELEDGETIISTDVGNYTCYEETYLLKTNFGKYFFLPDLNEKAIQLDFSSILLDQDDAIKNVNLLSLGANMKCINPFMLDGKEQFPFTAILRMDTTDDHAYLIGVYKGDLNQKLTQRYLFVKIK